MVDLFAIRSFVEDVLSFFSRLFMGLSPFVLIISPRRQISFIHFASTRRSFPTGSDYLKLKILDLHAFRLHASPIIPLCPVENKHPRIFRSSHRYYHSLVETIFSYILYVKYITSDTLSPYILPKLINKQFIKI